MHYIIYDIETTGLSPQQDEITQIAAVRMSADGAILPDETFATFVHTANPIPAHITALTGITDADVRDAPPPAQALRDFARFAGPDATLVAHNGRRFDARFITTATRRHAKAGARPATCIDHPCIDTLEISQTLWHAGWHNLDALARRLRVPPPTHHRRHDARADVLMLASCFHHLLPRLAQGPAPFLTHRVTLPSVPPPPNATASPAPAKP